jgi:hypothetical protein
MTETIEILRLVRDALSKSEDFPNFGSTLDDPSESLTIHIVNTDLRLVVKKESNVGTFIEDLVSKDDISRTFQESNANFDSMHNEFNRLFLECQARYMNHLLQSRGHVFLNEVYDALGFERTRQAAILGWIYKSEGMGYIDFGLHEDRNLGPTGELIEEPFLTFNVDGVIFDKI